jgi:predicted N-acetyltransferase YhbS
VTLIRAYEPGDAHAVNAVALEAFAQYRGVYSDWETLSRGLGAMAGLAEHGELIVAADEAGEIVGAVAYFGPGTTPRADFFDPEWPIIRMLVVSPAARGRGVGRKLTQE